MSGETKRLFLAFDLSIEVVNALVEARRPLVEKLKERSRKVQPVRPELIHLTLKFLGDTPTALIPRLMGEMEEVCEPLFSFDVGVAKVGVFPSSGPPRIAWAGIDDEGAEVLSLLHRNVDEELHERLGLDKERRPFKPHITLARMGGGAAVVEEWMEDCAKREFGRSPIRELALMASELGPEGPHYEVLRRFALGSQ